MTDFTKEELINLLSCVKSNKAFHMVNMEIIYPVLMKKIQSMIDNYCEHEYSKGCMECGAFECKKCEHYFSYEEIRNDNH